MKKRLCCDIMTPSAARSYTYGICIGPLSGKMRSGGGVDPADRWEALWGPSIGIVRILVRYRVNFMLSFHSSNYGVFSGWCSYIIWATSSHKCRSSCLTQTLLQPLKCTAGPMTLPRLMLRKYPCIVFSSTLTSTERKECCNICRVCSSWPCVHN